MTPLQTALAETFRASIAESDRRIWDAWLTEITGPPQPKLDEVRDKWDELCDAEVARIQASRLTSTNGAPRPVDRFSDRGPELLLDIDPEPAKPDDNWPNELSDVPVITEPEPMPAPVSIYDPFGDDAPPAFRAYDPTPEDQLRARMRAMVSGVAPISHKAAYTPELLAGFLRDVADGVSVTKSAKFHFIPTGSVTGLVNKYKNQIEAFRTHPGALDEYEAALVDALRGKVTA